MNTFTVERDTNTDTGAAFLVVCVNGKRMGEVVEPSKIASFPEGEERDYQRSRAIDMPAAVLEMMLKLTKAERVEITTLLDTTLRAKFKM